MKRGIVTLIVFLIMATAVYGAGFTLTSEPVHNTISQKELAIFNLTIYNNQSLEDTFFINNNNNLNWGITTDPLVDYSSGITVPAFGSKSTKVLLNPKDNNLGRHFVVIDVSSDKTGEAVDINNEIILQEHPLYTDPDLTINVEVSQKIDPRNPDRVRLSIKNNNGMQLENVTVSLKSNLIDKSSIITIKPFEETGGIFPLDLDPATQPQQDKINIMLVWNSTILYNSFKYIEIIPYGESLKKDYRITKSFLKTMEYISLSNNANSRITEQYTLKASFFDRVFGRTDPKAEIIDEQGKKYFVWSLNLDPGQSAELVLTRDYRGAFVVLVVLILLAIIFLTSKDPVALRKETLKISTKDGAITEMKIRIRVKNKKPMPLHEFKLIDRVPGMLSYVKGSSHLPPAKVYPHSNEGTVMEWHLGDLDPGQEREIIYDIKPSLHVIGNVQLKSTLAKYKIGTKEYKTYSNVLSIGAE